jgi:hypothetical protein
MPRKSLLEMDRAAVVVPEVTIPFNAPELATV